MFEHPDVLEHAQRDVTILPQVIRETMRWLSRSSRPRATSRSRSSGKALNSPPRHGQLHARRRDRDPSIFADPDRF